MEKDNIIFNLYDQLGKSGQRRDAQKFIADKCGVRMSSVKSNYLMNRELPMNLSEEIKDDIINYLEDQVVIENKIA